MTFVPVIPESYSHVLAEFESLDPLLSALRLDSTRLKVIFLILVSVLFSYSYFGALSFTCAPPPPFIFYRILGVLTCAVILCVEVIFS